MFHDAASELLGAQELQYASVWVVVNIIWQRPIFTVEDKRETSSDVFKRGQGHISERADRVGFLDLASFLFFLDFWIHQ